MLKIAICEDNPIHAQHLRDLLKLHMAFLQGLLGQPECITIYQLQQIHGTLLLDRVLNLQTLALQQMRFSKSL